VAIARVACGYPYQKRTTREVRQRMRGVLVVEDQQSFASALEVAIGVQPDLECVGATGTIDDALARMSRRMPDVVLMDIGLPGADGIEGTRRIRTSYPQVSVLILTAEATPARLAAAAAAGAAGFLAKDTPLSDILAAIRNPTEGKLVVEGTTLLELLENVKRLDEANQDVVPVTDPSARASGGPELAGLTAREREVLALMGEGLDPRAIAARLVVSLHTARGHVKRIMMKLGAHSQLETVVRATRAGLLPAAVPRQRDSGQAGSPPYGGVDSPL
jgi:DNA-binding NarL/FixJ family response regulator